MANFTAALLDRPAVTAAALVALAYLDDAAAAAARLGDRTDGEALHDFRVAIRRLRLTVRSYSGLHEIIPKRQRSRLRKLARATNAARDAEVQVAWFKSHAGQFTRAERAALAPLRARLRARRRNELAVTQRKLRQRFAKLERKLRHRLSALRADAGAHAAPFRAVAAATLLQHARDLRARLGETSPSSAPADLHTTRIAAKRLRYLMEPVEPGLPNGTRLIGRLKDLQDLFGELTDAHELEPVLKDGDDGEAAAAKLLRGEVAAQFKRLREEWSTAGVDLEREVQTAAHHLRPATRTPRSVQQRSRRRARGVTV
jgi:CHAD domain-containing protein